jgi:transketolase
MRTTLSKAVMRADDPRVLVVSVDMGFHTFDGYSRYVNVGISEQFAVDFALGAAKEGALPLVYGISSFITARAYEQIRYLVMHNMPCLIVGVGGGFCYSEDGPTHHAPDDVSLMSLIPGMDVRIPYDLTGVEQAFMQWLKTPGPMFMRIEKAAPALLRAPSKEPIDVQCVIEATGCVCTEAVKAYEQLKDEPVELQLYDRLHDKRTDVPVVTVEEIGCPAAFDFSHRPLAETRKARGVDVDSIVRRVHEALGR